ncbi:MAG: hypothetical protein WD847_13365 [Pirellulales bacterium]
MTQAPPSQFTVRGMLLAAAWVACACWLFILFPPCGLVMVALAVHLLLLRLDAWATWRRLRQGPPERDALIQFLRGQGAGGRLQATRPYLQFSLRTMLLVTTATGVFMSAAVVVTLPVAIAFLVILALIVTLFTGSMLAAHGNRAGYAILLAFVFGPFLFVALAILASAVGWS